MSQTTYAISFKDDNGGWIQFTTRKGLAETLDYIRFKEIEALANGEKIELTYRVQT